VRAIISDIHGNADALEAVLADIEKQGAEQIICLGDLIGYGPEPKRCIDLAMDFDIVLMGNHEQALMVQIEGWNFNVKARSSLKWTRSQLDLFSDDREGNAKRWDFLGSLEERYEEDGTLFVHGSPREPVTEYIYPRDIRRPDKLADIFSMMEHICFVGHTHVAGIWTDDIVYLTLDEVNYRYRFTGKKTIVNVGSVGQPRDGDIQACYVLQEDDCIWFRRVRYPLERTITKIREIPDLDPFLAQRLLEGR